MRTPRLQLVAAPTDLHWHEQSLLDEQQRRAVQHPHDGGPLLIIGAPGTGTSRTLQEVLLERIRRDGVSPSDILMLAPTRHAAARLRDQVATRLTATVQEPMSRSPHSYAFGILRRFEVQLGGAIPQLISGAEQDRIIADLLDGHAQGRGKAPAWPAAWGPEVLATRGFRDELRDLLMVAVERAMSPAQLARLGQQHQRPEWVAAATVLDEYLSVTALSSPGNYDPAGIIQAAVDLLQRDPELLAAEQERWSVVAFEDAHEMSDATFRLLTLLAPHGRLVATGDPDVATQFFRGARPSALSDLPAAIATDERPGATIYLPHVYRHGVQIRDAVTTVAQRIGTAGMGPQRKALAATSVGVTASSEAVAPEVPVEAPSEAPRTDDVRVEMFASEAQEASYIAATLREQHLVHGIPWSQMAVIMRSTRGADLLRRALVNASVPVTVASADLPLREENAVRPFLLAMGAVLDAETLDVDVVNELLLGPLGGADQVRLRRIRQALRVADMAQGQDTPSEELLVQAVRAEGEPVDLDPWLAEPIVRLRRILAAGRERAEDRTARGEDVLWTLWETSGLAERWQRMALVGSDSAVPGSRATAIAARADHDLDAMIALFDAAGRFTVRLPYASPAEFLWHIRSLDVPADTLAARAASDQAVTLTTAPGAAGLQWQVVVVPGVQEGMWPNLRLRGSILGANALADLLDTQAPGSDPAVTAAGDSAGAAPQDQNQAGYRAAARKAVLDDETRLFHVAISRARELLLITAVESEDATPSTFVDLIAPLPESEEIRRTTQVPRSMTLSAVVAELRSVAVDPAAHEQLRVLAARELARLARAGVPGAHPDEWFGVLPPSTEAPLRADDQTIAVSPSKVEQFSKCSLRWMLEQAGGAGAASVLQQLGTLIHELAQAEPQGDHEKLKALLDQRFSRLGLGENWLAELERNRADQMVAKFAQYAREVSASRDVVATELSGQVQVGRADLRGQIDRIERDDQGRLYVVDLKTGKSAIAKGDALTNAQLAAYQLLVNEGAFPQLGTRSAGASLIYVGTDTQGPSERTQAALPESDEPTWAHELVAQTAEGMAAAQFPATVNAGNCRTCPVVGSCPSTSQGRQVGPQ